jgi:hypothetical protein
MSKARRLHGLPWESYPVLHRFGAGMTMGGANPSALRHTFCESLVYPVGQVDIRVCVVEGMMLKRMSVFERVWYITSQV